MTLEVKVVGLVLLGGASREFIRDHIARKGVFADSLIGFILISSIFGMLSCFYWFIYLFIYFISYDFHLIILFAVIYNKKLQKNIFCIYYILMTHFKGKFYSISFWSMVYDGLIIKNHLKTTVSIHSTC